MDPGQKETPDNIGNLLAKERALSAGAARTKSTEDNFQAYTENNYAGKPENDNEEEGEDSQAAADNFAMAPANDNAQNNAEQEQKTNMAAAIASDMAQKKAARRKIGMRRNVIDKRMAELEKDLENIRRPKGGFTSFLKLNPFDMLDLVMPSLNSKINNASNSVKNARGAAKIRAIESAVAALKILMITLLMAYVPASVIDAIFKWFGLALKTRYLGPFFFVPLIILIILIPLLVPMLAVMYGIVKIGNLTSEIKAVRKRIKKTLANLEKELDNEKKKMDLRKQRQDLTAQEQAVQNSPLPTAPMPTAAKAPPLQPPQKLAA